MNVTNENKKIGLYLISAKYGGAWFLIRGISFSLDFSVVMPCEIMWAHEEGKVRSIAIALAFLISYLRPQQHESPIPKFHVLSLTAVVFVNFAVHMYPHGLKRDRSPICGFMERVFLHPTGVV